MNQIGFSIIIPCYNAGHYLAQCIKSVLSQPYQNYEVILINDGSTDNTKEILDHYHQQDNRLVVIHKRNQGVSSARNDGLRLAQKEYILFLDADDFMKENILPKISKLLQNTLQPYDMVIGCHMAHYYEATNETKLITNVSAKELQGQAKETILAKTIGNPNTMGIWAVWRHVYRRDLLKQHNIFFDICYGYGEDMDWLIQVMLKSEHFAFTEEVLCFYRFDNAASATNQYSVRSVCNHIEILAKWIHYFETVDYNKTNKTQILRRLSNKMMAIIKNINHLDDSQRKIALRYFQQYQPYLRHVHGLKFQGAHFLTKTIGLSTTAKLLGEKKTI